MQRQFGPVFILPYFSVGTDVLEHHDRARAAQTENLR